MYTYSVAESTTGEFWVDTIGPFATREIAQDVADKLNEVQDEAFTAGAASGISG